MKDDDFRKEAEGALAKTEGGKHAGKLQEFLEQMLYFSGNYDDPESFKGLASRLEEIDGEGQLCGNRLFYLATPPDVYPHIIKHLGRSRAWRNRKRENAGRGSSSKSPSGTILSRRGN